MKYYIRRCYKKEQEWGNGYLAPRDYDKRTNKYRYLTHWVMDKNESIQFNSCKEAREFIKEYGLKNCDVEKEPKRRIKYEYNIK